MMPFSSCRLTDFRLRRVPQPFIVLPSACGLQAFVQLFLQAALFDDRLAFFDAQSPRLPSG
jgi:hypothetical protein